MKTFFCLWGAESKHLIFFRWGENSQLHWRCFARNVTTERQWHRKAPSQFASIHQNLPSLDCQRQDNRSKVWYNFDCTFLKVLQCEKRVSCFLTTFPIKWQLSDQDGEDFWKYDGRIKVSVQSKPECDPSSTLEGAWTVCGASRSSQWRY